MVFIIVNNKPISHFPPAGLGGVGEGNHMQEPQNYLHSCCPKSHRLFLQISKATSSLIGPEFHNQKLIQFASIPHTPLLSNSLVCSRLCPSCWSHRDEQDMARILRSSRWIGVLPTPIASCNRGSIEEIWSGHKSE